MFALIAEALETSHEQGIIHRDLKPGNIKVSDDGKVKVLDFGLGKAMEARPEPISGDAPTRATTPDSTKMSQEGIVLGTPVDMSPEQAQGKAVDKRTDIWAFGCCLYEVLTGKLPFHGETVSATLAKVLESDPDWELLPQDTPWRIRELLESCLEKDTRLRLRDAGDAWATLRRIATESGRLTSAAERIDAPRIRRSRIGVVAVCILGVAVGAAPFGDFDRFRGEEAQPLTQLDPKTLQTMGSAAPILEGVRGDTDYYYSAYAISENGLFIYEPGGEVSAERKMVCVDRQGEARSLASRTLAYRDPRVAPDGRWMAYTSDESGQREVYVQPFPELGGKRQISTDGGTYPLWSPTGDELFYRDGDRMIAVEVALGDSFSPGISKVLFEKSFHSGGGRDYDISPDGQRFLMIQRALERTGGNDWGVVENWFEELKRLAPVPEGN